MTAVPLPDRMRWLAKDHRGFVVPWFVQWFEAGKPAGYGVGTPDFRIVDSPKFVRAIKQRRCWVCGAPLGSHLAFAIGPMCAINRTTSEPPAHRDCALYALHTCPFMIRPRMRRSAKDLPEIKPIAGMHLDHNPGAMCLWTTRRYRIFEADVGGSGVLLNLGDPLSVEWFAEGRAASRDEVEAAIAKGLPFLRDVAAKQGGESPAVLERHVAAFAPLLPPVSP
jgi:hypothetical protein